MRNDMNEFQEREAHQAAQERKQEAFERFCPPDMSTGPSERQIKSALKRSVVELRGLLQTMILEEEEMPLAVIKAVLNRATLALELVAGGAVDRNGDLVKVRIAE